MRPRARASSSSSSSFVVVVAVLNAIVGVVAVLNAIVDVVVILMPFLCFVCSSDMAIVLLFRFISVQARSKLLSSDEATHRRVSFINAVADNC